MAAFGLESVHFKTTFSEQLAVAVSEIVLLCYLHLALILHIRKNIYLVTLLHWSSHSGIFSVKDALSVPLETSSEHLTHVQVTTCVHGNFEIFELDQRTLSLSLSKKNCVEVAFNKPAGL